MKKKRTSDRPAPDFRNNPFTSLKTIKPKLGPAPRTEKRTAAQAKEEVEDPEELFLRAVSGAKTLHPEEQERTIARRPDRKLSSEELAGEPEENELFLAAMKKMGPSFHSSLPSEELYEVPRTSASGRMKQLKRGTIRISAELDLHGCLRDEALVKLRQFLAAASVRGQEAVLVITGKGMNSPEGPVLQVAVAGWLRGQGKALVAEFAPAPRDKGGSGAFVVFLKHR